jgi:hypothetical protein
MSIAKHHAEWLSLIEVSGPFLSLPVLVQRFPQGMDAHDPEHAKALRQVYEEWDQDQNGDRPDPAIHRQWIDWVLRNTLDLGDVLVEGQKIPQTLKADLAEHSETLRPDKVVMEPDGGKARLLIQTYPLRQKLSRVVEGKPWAASPDTRMMQLLHDTGVRIGLVTNGDQWMLVDAPKGETTGYASWYASLWLEEPKTLQAFRTLLGSYRFFGVPEEETLERLLAQSAQDQQEVTDQLGYQVRQAVEVLVHTIDRANRDSGGAMLKGVPEDKLYEAALTVMMRLVFLFCAEERDLLLLGDELYDKNYSVSTLREQLRVTANNFGEEVLERRHDAWSRLLTTFRAVYGGIQHKLLKLPAYKGELFDPDRFPFLEGRKAGTSWKDTPSQPIPVDNRTVLHLLEALQMLQVRLPGGGPATPRKLSFRALSILQIGHVYEGLLDHTAVKATEPVLGLNGPRDHEPEVPLAKLEALAAKGEDELLSFVKEETGRSSVATVKRLLATALDDLTLSRFRTACQGDEKLWERIKPFAGLVRLDTFDYPVVILPGSVYVTAGTDRRSSGTHYTPESLTEPIVRYTLEPLVYEGPAEGKPRDQWKLKSPKELLDLKICDMACGSGAFLVQVCIYLAERLLEAWEAAEKRVEGSPRITPYGEVSTGLSEEQLIPIDRQERLTYARRLVAERCVYGVDKNPLAVEMAKLSLWLLTLAKDKPFTFLDHAIRCGDSLVGLSSINQLLRFSMTENAKVRPLMEQQRQQIGKRMDAVKLLRSQIEMLPSNTAQDIERKTLMLANVEDQTGRLRYAADLLLAATWEAKTEKDRESALNSVLAEVEFRFKDLPAVQLEEEAKPRLARAGITSRFHWPLEFPEATGDGFDGFVGNPPFVGNKYWKERLPNGFQRWAEALTGGRVGKIDVVALFFRRTFSLLKRTGKAGLIATTTAREGDTLNVGFRWISETGELYRAISQENWPGLAGVHFCVVWFGRSASDQLRILDDQPTETIASSLTSSAKLELPKLLSQTLWVFQGSHNARGESFILTKSDPWFDRLRSARSPFLRPYITGEDITTGAYLQPVRYVIDCEDLRLEQVSQVSPETGRFLSEVVACRRTPDELVSYPGLAERWWQLWNHRAPLYRELRRDNVCIVMPVVSKHIDIVEMPTSCVFTNKVCVYKKPEPAKLILMLSALYEAWIVEMGGTLRAGTLTVTIEKCILTFPAMSDESDRWTSQVSDWFGAIDDAIREWGQGLTNVFNRVNNFQDCSPRATSLRKLRTSLDESALKIFGWSDLSLGHDFHETKQGTRFTISEEARREVLARLLKLNHERYSEEVAQGLHDKGKGKPKAAGRKGKKASSSDESLLF